MAHEYFLAVSLMPTPRRLFGDRGEAQAATFLKDQGYEILERNFLVRGGEIDLIARQGDALVFVEVKTRSNEAFGPIVEAVTDRKLEKLVSAAEEYLARRDLPEDTLWRLDLITIDHTQIPPQIEHFENITE